MNMETSGNSDSGTQAKTAGENWLVHFFKAGGYSMAGLGAALKHEMAFRMELAAFVILAPCALLVPADWLLRFLVVSAMLLVLATELMNSAMEWVVDYISHERHPYAKRAKDMGSAAVLVSLLNAGLWWGFLLWEWLG